MNFIYTLIGAKHEGGAEDGVFVRPTPQDPIQDQLAAIMAGLDRVTDIVQGVHDVGDR